MSVFMHARVFLRKKDVDILDDMGVSKLSAKVFIKVNYSFKLFGP